MNATRSDIASAEMPNSALVPRVALFAIALAALLASALVNPSVAEAKTVEQLQLSYFAAEADYEDALVQKDQNKGTLAAAAVEMKIAEAQVESAQEDLSVAASTYYKQYPGRARLVDMLIGSSSIDEAVACYEYYARIERQYSDKLAEAVSKRERLESLAGKLEAARNAIEAEILARRQAAADAKEAWLDASHADGADYHQTQGVDNNCGATAFTVGLNILLHEERYPDNVAVWRGAGFNCDSTTNLAGKAIVWLAANGLGDQIEVETVPGDIHTTDQLKAELMQGHVVIISSGPGSVWQYAGGVARPGLFPFGHWIVFYNYSDGVFYANDSSVGPALGAGCPYDEDEMQQWLNGRSNHFAVSLAKRD